MKHTSAQISCGLKIAGCPENAVDSAPEPKTVASAPERIALLKARLLKSKGDRVNIGTPLYEDKQNTDILFAAPGAGTIEDIVYGPRRVIREIVIRLDKEQTAEAFTPYPAEKLAGITPGALTEILLKSGVWPLLRDIVYRKVADPGQSPAAIWVAATNQDPFHPPPDTWLQSPQDRRFFQTGIKALEILSSRVFVCCAADTGTGDAQIENRITHRVLRGYPFDDPAVVHYHVKTRPEDNHAWFVNGQDVRLIGEFLETGRFPVRRTVAVSGQNVPGRYRHTRMGAPLGILADPGEDSGRRWIAGGLFRGYSSGPDFHLGLYETAVNIIEESGKREMLGFMRPGWNKPTCSKTFLSVFNPRPLAVDADMHGSGRACVNCGSCTRACPVDILPQFTYKCIRAGEIEEALSHGMLDCVECGLCSYVCPSKIELCQTFQETKQAYFRQRI
ncbi:MAG: 4Fe-4S dicluster domain-containing protein [Desulfobacterales bacterium]|nr:4Fe-4S dicluster domain-containing protein [Desulfobacterales bacterium]